MTLSLLAAPLCAADPVALTVHAAKPVKTVDVRIYGQFLEHIFNSVHGGLWGDQILNGTLETRPSAATAPAAATSGAQASMAPAGRPTGRNIPRGWEFVGTNEEVRNDRDNPFNAESSVHLEAKTDAAPALRQRHIALRAGQSYTLSLYVRGSGTVQVGFDTDDKPLLAKPLTGLTPQWQRYTLDFTPTQDADDATLTFSVPPAGAVNLDQISLFSAAALANHKLRPDLYQAIADLKPATIRWPGGSFANKYIWQNGIGPAEKRLPHPVEQWNDRDPNQFGTDEFLQMCERLGAEPILVLNTSRGVEDALQWLEYCLGDASTEYGKRRAANGHPAPYKLNTIEIDNETWLMMKYPQYVSILRAFCPAIRAKYPHLTLSVCGSYAYDTGPGEGVKENANWDPRLLQDAAGLFNVLSPHYYNGLLREHAPDYREDPRTYEQFLRGRGELIRKSDNPNIKIYVSEWNLTYGPWGNDWRTGLYAGGILNTFERQADLVTMSCPALFMRKIGVTRSWDNALINFDQKSWFPAGNYVVMKLWRDAYAPGLLQVDGPERPLNVVAVRTDDASTLFLKVVNPEKAETEAVFTLDGFPAKTATMQVIAPGAEEVKNSLAEPTRIKAVDGQVTLKSNRLHVRFPPLSAGVIKVNR